MDNQIGRPKNEKEYVKIGTSIDKELNDKLDEYCEVNMTVKNKVIERAIKEFIEKGEN